MMGVFVFALLLGQVRLHRVAERDLSNGLSDPRYRVERKSDEGGVPKENGHGVVRVQATWSAKGAHQPRPRLVHLHVGAAENSRSR